MALAKTTVDCLASRGYTVDEIVRVDQGMSDVIKGDTLTFDQVIRDIKKDKTVHYV